LSFAKRAGFDDPRLVTQRELTIENPALEARVAPLRFNSSTYRLFKLEGLEPACEDYGQAVIYKGTIETAPHGFQLDDHHYMEAGKVFAVCGNTWKMLAETRHAEHFEFIGDFSKHYGIFEGCGGESPFAFYAQRGGLAQALCLVRGRNGCFQKEKDGVDLLGHRLRSACGAGMWLLRVFKPDETCRILQEAPCDKAPPEARYSQSQALF